MFGPNVSLLSADTARTSGPGWEGPRKLANVSGGGVGWATSRPATQRSRLGRVRAARDRKEIQRVETPGVECDHLRVHMKCLPLAAACGGTAQVEVAPDPG